MHNELIAAKDFDANISTLFLLSRNSYGPIGNMFKNYSIRDAIQSFLNELVDEGIIAYQRSESGYALFKVKGVDELKKVSTSNYFPPMDYLFNTFKDETTIEDLLSFAATKNGVAIQDIIKAGGYEFNNAEKAKLAASYIVLSVICASVNNIRVTIPAIAAASMAKKMHYLSSVENQYCPTPKLK